MPFVSDIGNVGHGVGGGYANVNNSPFSPGGVLGWMDSYRLAFTNGAANWVVYNYDIRVPLPGALTPMGGQANSGFAGGGQAAWFLATSDANRGLYSTTGLRLPDAGLLGMGPDAAIAYKPQYHSNGPTHIREFDLDGTDYQISPGSPAYVQLLGSHRALMTTYGFTVEPFNMPQPLYTNDGGLWKFEAAFAGNRWWGCYFCNAHGLVLHPFDSFMGFPVVPVGNAWHTIREHGPYIRVAISTGQAEQAGEIWVRDYDVVNNLMRNPWGGPGLDGWQPATLVDVRTINNAPQEPITPINKRMYLGFYTGQPGASGGWDTNDDPAGEPPPSNCRLDVPSGKFLDALGVVTGEYISGGSVEEIEQKAAAAQHTPIVYWDSNDWPRWPSLPADSWLCQRAYCPATWSPTQLENYIHAKLQDLLSTRPSQKVALVGQCYTSNNSLTTNLAALVPPYSRLGAAFSNIIAIIGFSGTGRKTGLQDHPEVRPFWQELYNTITGPPEEPTMGNGIDENGVCVDPHAYFNSLVAGTDAGDYVSVLTRIGPDLYKYGIGQQNNSNGVPRGRLFMPWSACPNAAPRPGNDTDLFLGVNQMASCCGIGDVPCKKVDVVDFGATQWTWVERDPQLDYVPIPAPDGPPPEPNYGVVITDYYPNPVRRGDVRGLTVHFDSFAANPVVERWIFLEDGERKLKQVYPINDPDTVDGRYHRGIAFKPVVNSPPEGWVLRVKEKDSAGNWGQSDGTHRVIVTV